MTGEQQKEWLGMSKEKLLEILGADFDSEKLEALTNVLSSTTQSEADRVRTKYAKEKKELEDKLKSIEMENMTELEKQKALLKEKEMLIAEKEKDTQFKLKTLYLKDKGMDLSLIDYVKGENEEEWNNSYSSVNEIINKNVEARLKNESGRDDLGGNKEPKENLSFEDRVLASMGG